MPSESKGISLDIETWKKLQAWADKEKRSLSNAAEWMISSMLENLEKETK